MPTCYSLQSVSDYSNQTRGVQTDNQDGQSSPAESATPTGMLDNDAVADAARLMPVILDAMLTVRQDTELAAKGFTQTDRDCPACTPGVLWSHNNEVICDCCSVVFDEEDRRRRGRGGTDRWTAFQQNREYYRSGRVRCPGGYPHVYEWVQREDLDRGESVVTLDPTEFYR